VGKISNEGEKQMENTSGMRQGSDVPAEIQRWNWGAFFFGWLWGICNGYYLALLTFLPFVGLIMKILLGLNGSKWAWQNKKWESVEKFKQVQHNWAVAAGIVFFGMMGIAVLGIVAAILIPEVAKHVQH